MEIRLARHGRHIAIVTIDNQRHLNAMTRTMLAELGRLWDELERDGSCRAIVLTGAGTRAFTVGADIAGDLSAGPEIARMVNHALLKTDVYAKPIIAAVNGYCVGGGLELMLASDIRAAVPEARFGLTEVKWSIYPFGGSTTKLVQQIGYVHAMDLLLTARLINAEEAARLGLVNRLVARDQLMGWAIETAEQIAANSPSAVQAVKRQVTATIVDYVLSREAQEQELGEKVRAGPHFAEGVAAFREKRQPRYE
jgi:enoyl-CoA hydratase/carnithine racemase